MVFALVYFFNTAMYNINKMLQFIVHSNLAYVVVWVEPYKHPLAAMYHKQVVVPNLFVVLAVPAVAEFVGLDRKDCITD